MSPTTTLARDPAVEAPSELGRVRPATEAAEVGPRWSGALAFPALLILGALDAAGYSILAPVLPTIAATTGAGPATIGLLVASFPGALLAGIAVAGARLRHTPTATMMLAALALLGLGCAGFAHGQGLLGYAVARAVMGLGSGGLWMAITFATLRRWPGQAYPRMSRILAAYSVGGLLGPALGAIGGVRGPFLAYLALLAAAIPLVLVALPGGSAEPPAFRPDRAALRLPGFWLASAGALLTILGLGILEGVLPLRLAAHLDQARIGAVYAVIAVLVAAGATVAGTIRPRAALTAGSVLVVAGIGVAGAAGGLGWLVVGLAVAGTGVGLGETGATGVLLDTVAPERIVTAMVVWSQIGIVGYLLGPALGGAAAQALGFGALGVVPLAVATAVAAGLHLTSGARRPTSG
jgi:MFS family permease